MAKVPAYPMKTKGEGESAKAKAPTMAKVPVIVGNCEDDAIRSTDNDNDCYK